MVFAHGARAVEAELKKRIYGDIIAAAMRLSYWRPTDSGADSQLRADSRQQGAGSASANPFSVLLLSMTYVCCLLHMMRNICRRRRLVQLVLTTVSKSTDPLTAEIFLTCSFPLLL